MDHKFLENANELVINQLSARLPFGVKVWCKWYMYQANEPTVDTHQKECDGEKKDTDDQVSGEQLRLHNQALPT